MSHPTAATGAPAARLATDANVRYIEALWNGTGFFNREPTERFVENMAVLLW